METLIGAEVKRYMENNNLRESQVISLSLGQFQETLALTIRYAGISQIEKQLSASCWPPEKPRPVDFRQLSFQDVNSLQRSRVRYKHGFQGFDRQNLEYSCRDSFGVVIEDVLLRECSDRFYIQLDLGSYGKYSFQFGSLVVRQRFGVGILNGSQNWEYVDVSSRRAFDFYEPFAES